MQRDPRTNTPTPHRTPHHRTPIGAPHAARLKHLVTLRAAAPILAAASLAAAGCANNAPNRPLLGPPPTQGETAIAPARLPRVSLGSPELQQVLSVEPPRTDRNNGRTTVSTTARNTSHHRYTFAYRVYFYDRDGSPVAPTPPPPTQLMIDPGQTATLRGQTDAPNAHLYRVHIEWAPR